MSLLVLDGILQHLGEGGALGQLVGRRALAGQSNKCLVDGSLELVPIVLASLYDGLDVRIRGIVLCIEHGSQKMDWLESALLVLLGQLDGSFEDLVSSVSEF